MSANQNVPVPILATGSPDIVETNLILLILAWLALRKNRLVSQYPTTHGTIRKLDLELLSSEGNGDICQIELKRLNFKLSDKNETLNSIAIE